ncbi:hypothetical protein EDD16DRAFT_1717422 [Pisolithus croceorrhizus]|nr:hypothetical protein EDD16DRAFT_1717422 [Pisolithus croceorrhizus]
MNSPLATKADLQLADLLASKKAVIIGAPPLHDSKSSRAKRIFYNGKTDYDGPVCLPNPAKTRIKRQVGGGKTTNRIAEDDGHSSSSPSPVRTLRSMMHKAAVGERDSSGKGAPKSMYSRKKVEVVVTMTAKKLGKQPPSIITIGDSSEPGETNIGNDEQRPSTRKRKADSQQSLRPTKQVATSLNMNTTQFSNPKVTKAPSQPRIAPKKRLQIVSPFDSDSPSEERLPGAITARDSSTKQLASSLESDTIWLPSPKVMNASPQTRPVTKKNKLRFISPLSSELSSEKELRSDPPRDEPNATSSKASTDCQQPSVEIHIKQSRHTQLAPSPPQEKRLSDVPSHHGELPNLPSQEPLRNEETQSQQPSRQVQEDQQSSRTLNEPHTIRLPSELHQEPPQPEVQSQLPQPHTHVGQSVTSSQITGASHPEHHSGEVEELQRGQEHTKDAQACGVPLAGARSTKPMGDATALHETACESPQEWPEVMVSLPVAGATESGGGVRTIHHNPPPHLPIQHSYLQSRRPRPRPVRAVGRNDDLDVAFNLHQRIYPGTSIAESTIPSSAASVRLLAAEEGYVGVSPGERGMELEPPAGESPGELYLGQPHLPLPHCQRDPQMNRDHQLQVNVGADRMYSRDDQFSYDGIPYHPSINPGWYDPSHRGSEVCYGPYHPQFILPPPFAPHRYPAHGYANDPTIHWPPGARGFGHHTNVPPPFHGAHETEYANAGGSPPSDAGALLGTQSGLEHSAGTRQDAVLDSTDPPAGSDIATTGDM